MAGSLKAVCATGQAVHADSAPFATLNAQTNFSVSGWFELASAVPANVSADLFAAATTGMVGFGTQNAAFFDYSAKSAVPNSIHANPAINTNGHFVVISYDGAGTTTIYQDGAAIKTASALGTTDAVDQAILIGYDVGGPAVVIYFKDLAIWGGHSLSQQNVLDLRDGVHTPANLTPPATNWWTLQGSPGTVTAGAGGLADSIGSVPLGTITGAGTLTYDAHEIVLSPSARMLNPYVDTTGNLIVVPLYKDTLTTTGGPATPTTINVVPTFKLNGSTITPTLVDIVSTLYVILYEMPSLTGGVSCGPSDVLTMAAPLGWASTTSGLVEGTSASGLGSGPMTLINNAHTRLETAFQPTKSLRLGYNCPPFGNANNVPGQPRANYASRIPWKAWSGGLTYASNGLPLTVTPGGGGASVNVINSPGNKIDSLGSPDTEGLWTLIYGDASTGVGSGAPNQQVELGFNPSWNVTRTPASGTTGGSWNGSAWTGMTVTYHAVYSGSGTYGIGLSINITSTNGNVGFPDKGNGQVELGIFPPSPTNRAMSSPVTWDPLAVDPEYLLKLQGTNTVRWMSDIGGFGPSGDSTMLTVADLAQRQVNDFLWTKLQPTVTANVTKFEPIGATFNAFIDYQGTTQSMSANNWNASSLYTRVPMLVTTDSPHGLRTGDPFSITSPVAPAAAADQTGFRLAAGITSGAASPVTFTTNAVSPPVVASQVVLIDSEQFTVVSISGSSVTATRGTPATHLINAPIYIKFLMGSVNGTSDPVTITIPDTTNADGTIQIDSEQLIITGILTATTMTVSRAANGTTKAAHSIGAVVYPCLPFFQQGAPPFVINSTQFVFAPFTKFLPSTSDPAISNPTIATTVNYTVPNQPVFSQTKPSNGGSVPYEFAAKTTNTIAIANGHTTILWINVAFLATDALVTEVIANRIIPYIGPNISLVLELSNEIWNSSGAQFYLSNVLATTAPNPETMGTGFTDGGYAASRQNHITQLAKAAFAAAGISTSRVYNFQAGQHQVNPTQGTSQASVAHCQVYNIPIDYLSPDGYVDITTDVWNLWWSWMPTADGGTASWSRPIAMRTMMSYFRVWCWYSQYFGGGILGNAQLLSWYNRGKLVSANGVGSGNTNTGLGKLCFYEASVEIITDIGTDVTVGNFIHADAIEQDLVYDGRQGLAGQWAADTGWLATEEAYFASMQSSAQTYANLMPSASFPDLTAGTSAFTCQAYPVYAPGSQGQLWYINRWQGQQAGTGASNIMTVPDATAWSSATPVARDPFNVSVRGQAALNWLGVPTPTPTPPPPTLSSISVTPANPQITSGATQQFTATGTYSDSSTQNLTSQVTWSSVTPSVATIDATGLATSAGVGTSSITATLTGISGSTLLTVTAATLVSIAVTPASPSIAKGLNQQFAATGTYSDSSTQNITSQVTWASATPSVATITTTGLAVGVLAGTSSISATLGIVSGSTTLTVTAAALQSIAVTPASPTVSIGTTQQFTATGTYTDGSTQNLTSSATWNSATPSVATIVAATGLATGVSVGMSVISATSTSITGSTVLTVTAATLVSIAVTPVNPSVSKGLTRQFTATGTYTDTSTRNLTSQVTWASATPSVATIANTGLATGVLMGTSSISATAGSISGSTTLTVTAAVLQSIAVTPASPTISSGTTQQFTATGTYTDSSTQNLTTSATWTSAVPSVATIVAATGLATGVSVGMSSITATLGISGLTVLRVTSATLRSITVTPVNPSIANGTTQQFTATGTYTDNSTQTLTSQVTWASVSTGVATIAASGLATGVGAGTSTINATLDAIAGSTLLTITAATLVSIAVTPINPSIPQGTTQQFTATGTYTDSSTQNITNQVTWASAVPSIATITATGLATGVRTGISQMSATFGGIKGSVVSTVILPTPTPTPTPTSSIDIIDPKFGMTPMYTVVDTVERNLIPASMRITGMICYSLNDRAVWRLLQPPWTFGNNDWVPFP